ncbi:hypothetical protein [Actinomadura sp. 9N407]|uniref:hypothetical protein n=1 Tax=Actinomadura sp. 9N407 TaxID=3375154 RepID=UPI0037ABB85D
MNGISAKLDLLRRTESEHRFGVTIDAPRELEPIPELPAGVTDVFRTFHELGGDFFVFRQPEEIANPRAWAERPELPGCPLGHPLEIGYERYDTPEGIVGAPIRLDLQDGSVYYCDPDDYVFFYKNVDVEIETVEFAPDIVTFFDHNVLGPGYPELVEAVVGRRRDDNWQKLLKAAGLV